MSNTTTNTTIANGSLVQMEDDTIVKVGSYNRGWYTVFAGDTEAKVRKADLEAGTILPEDFETEDDDEVSVAKQMSKQLAKYREGYVVTTGTSGRKSLSNGDDLAMALEGATLEQVYNIAEHLLQVDFRDRYQHLNIGSQRMNLGNRLRSAFKNEDHESHDVVTGWVATQLAD